MVFACLIATIQAWDGKKESLDAAREDEEEELYDPVDGPSEEEAYLQGDSDLCSLRRWTGKR